ncbi:tyrosine-type recombinase/integrase [Streptomyces malaysiensis]|uniref:tyrosine-type recombinase/integrase n=1 Tax=Streptomyces malaysiensis TaxID=92644 RepID=UPI001650ECD0|nr:tyrosine-type recombinase/integrase [Streptomyces malaysiensis]
MLTTDIIPAADARAVLAQSRGNALAHAGVALLLLAGLRPGEVEALRVADYERGGDGARLRTGALRHPRGIRIASSAAAALDAYLATQAGVDEEDFLLPELRTTRLVQLVRGSAAAAGVQAGVHDLRKAAVAAVLEDGAPVSHVEAYFGMSKAPGRKDLVPVRDGYDAGIADVLEHAFA